MLESSPAVEAERVHCGLGLKTVGELEGQLRALYCNRREYYISVRLEHAEQQEN